MTSSGGVYVYFVDLSRWIDAKTTTERCFHNQKGFPVCLDKQLNWKENIFLLFLFSFLFLYIYSFFLLFIFK